MRRTVIVMVKEPRAGRVKTRLAQDIGVIPATWWFRHQLRDLLRRIQSPRWDLVLAVAPDVAVGSRFWPQNMARLPQGGGDLGARMARMLRSAAGPTCVIGADIPGITSARLAQAFQLLGCNDAVFGPAPDGGFWLIGVRHPARLPHGFFRDVRWSSEHALSDGRATLPGWRIGLAEHLQDVDNGADLQKLRLSA